jgi:uncharacterized membrane protein YadS
MHCDRRGRPDVARRASDTGVALTCVVVLGSTGMLLYPWLAMRSSGNDVAAGMFLGTAITTPRR